MKRKVLIFIFIVFSMKSISQNNLVINGDFETTISCNIDMGDLAFAPPWNSPTIGTPDLFHSCIGSSGNLPGIPLNRFGYQFAHSGSAYAGFYAMYIGSLNNREYIQGQLSNKLIHNKLYYFSALISPSDIPTPSYYLVGIDKIGVYFSNISYYDPVNNFLLVTPQIVSDTSKTYSNTINWMKISGYYRAKGDEQYLTIGNFADDAHTDTSWLSVSSVLPIVAGISYYYIDDVSLICLDCDSTSSLSFPNIFSPNYDGVNDEFYPGAKNIELYNCKIFNRLGGEVAELLTANQKWNGVGKYGIELPEGTYYYLAIAKGKDGVEYKRKGFVELVR
jgi:gliding motility-associated-like protein